MLSSPACATASPPPRPFMSIRGSTDGMPPSIGLIGSNCEATSRRAQEREPPAVSWRESAHPHRPALEGARPAGVALAVDDPRERAVLLDVDTRRVGVPAVGVERDLLRKR